MTTPDQTSKELEDIIYDLLWDTAGVHSDHRQPMKDRAKQALLKWKDEQVEKAMIAYKKELLKDYEKDIREAKLAAHNFDLETAQAIDSPIGIAVVIYNEIKQLHKSKEEE